MGQNYIPDKTMLLCTTGTKMSRLKVTNQNTVRMPNGRLIGTYLDKMEDNLFCTLLSTVGAAVGAICVGALAVALGATGIGLAAFVVGGAMAGSMIKRIPCICAMISAPFWTLPHPTVRIGGIAALPKNADLKCTLGGTVNIMLMDLIKALQCALISQHLYKNGGGIEKSQLDSLGITPVDNKDLPPNLRRELNNGRSGFHAKVYKIKDSDGTETYVLAFRGTEKLIDWGANVKQGMGFTSKQYKRTARIAQEFGDAFGDKNILITGHSKGGGQATLAGAILNVETYAYNPAGVHDNTFSKNDVTREDADAVTHSFHAQDRDILNTIQDSKSVLSWVRGLGFALKVTKALPSAAGNRIGMETDASMSDFFTAKGHKMPAMIGAIEKELEMELGIDLKQETKIKKPTKVISLSI